mgnify:CR=1 FL=1
MNKGESDKYISANLNLFELDSELNNIYAALHNLSEANDFDEEFGQMEVTLKPNILQPANGTIQLIANEKIQYQPNPLFIGEDAFQYIVLKYNIII